MQRSVFVLAGTVALGLISPAFAADLMIDEPAMPGMVEAAGGNWEGMYLGVFGGYSWGSFTDEEFGYYFPDDKLDVDGFHLGVAAGANFYLSDSVIAGVVGDLAWSNQTGSLSDYNSEGTINWFGSVRGKLGYDAGAYMPYLTAGLAFANGTFFQTSLGPNTDTQTHVGWTAGAGVAIAVTDSMSIDLSYRYADYGSRDYDIYNPDSELGLTDHIVSVGLNWKF